MGKIAEQHTVFIALSTNVGRRAANLRAALASFSPQVRVVNVSPVYETAPWGFTEQSIFFNSVIQAETSLAPVDLLVYLKQLEKKLGRQPTFRNGPRLQLPSASPAARISSASMMLNLCPAWCG